MISLHTVTEQHKPGTSAEGNSKDRIESDPPDPEQITLTHSPDSVKRPSSLSPCKETEGRIGKAEFDNDDDQPKQRYSTRFSTSIPGFSKKICLGNNLYYLNYNVLMMFLHNY